ncbi:hypothetical protein IWX50DRAFT_13631 [Phyllosticta citricarpa]
MVWSYEAAPVHQPALALPPRVTPHRHHLCTYRWWVVVGLAPRSTRFGAHTQSRPHLTSHLSPHSPLIPSPSVAHSLARSVSRSRPFFEMCICRSVDLFVSGFVGWFCSVVAVVGWGGLAWVGPGLVWLPFVRCDWIWLPSCAVTLPVPGSPDFGDLVMVEAAVLTTVLF